MIEKRKGIKISVPEEIAYINGWVNRETILKLAKRYGKSPYGEYIKHVTEGQDILD